MTMLFGRIWGREPALWLGLIGALFTVGAALELPWLTAGQAAAIAGALSALLIALTTRPVAPALFTAALVAVVAMFAEYGLTVSDEAVGSLAGLILAGFAFFGVRPQVTPVTDPRPLA